ncbi:porphobilinogen synthase [Isachenkonia alkalipeptolytica]|uniref:Delta-aminolevulinic acid dehydratase n=1 Tax=Isachenkonia alkalipeptolytica TaxID=2565777 RepID=A0AA43XIB8_9CLOT|nr:porphobilinogen synthase [Isachenkonia alkalipeptolytica]NBG87097.1 porphobilinogen synthase [Isachenkonia alkalipeptolytica]
MSADNFTRSRRLRRTSNIRKMVSETKVTAEDLIYPIFVTQGKGIKKEIPNMPGQFHYSVDQLGEAIEEVVSLGIPAVMVFGIPKTKDFNGSGADDADGIVQQGVREIKKKFPDLTVITDVCMCQYTTDGHCGLVVDGEVVNDPSLERLGSIAFSHAEAGADMVAPSDMMDGRVLRIRRELDQADYQNVAIMSYSVKYASSFYAPFRGAVNSAPSFGDRKTYQMDPRNRLEAKRQAAIDLDEGADILMVKPALAYLDIIREVKGDAPLAAYHVSGEYAMFKLAAKNGLIDETEGMVEILTSIKRAGADLILTYFAKDMAKHLHY